MQEIHRRNTALSKAAISLHRAVITAAIAVCSVTLAAPVQADPAAGCPHWAFPGGINLFQNNGYSVSIFGPPGDTISGDAFAQNTDHTDQMKGTATGRPIEGNAVDFTINWDSGPRGRYKGDINNDGLIFNGLTVDIANPGSGSGFDFDKNTPLKCVR